MADVVALFFMISLLGGPVGLASLPYNLALSAAGLQRLIRKESACFHCVERWRPQWWWPWE